MDDKVYKVEIRASDGFHAYCLANLIGGIHSKGCNIELAQDVHAMVNEKPIEDAIVFVDGEHFGHFEWVMLREPKTYGGKFQ